MKRKLTADFVHDFIIKRLDEGGSITFVLLDALGLMDEAILKDWPNEKIYAIITKTIWDTLRNAGYEPEEITDAIGRAEELRKLLMEMERKK